MTWFFNIDYYLWEVIQNTYHVTINFENGMTFSNLNHKWNELKERNVQLNAKTMWYLHCALDINEYNMISQYEITKDRLLEITHEYTNQVKEFMINILVHNYELFSMKDLGFIIEMFIGLMEITNKVQRPTLMK